MMQLVQLWLGENERMWMWNEIMHRSDQTLKFWHQTSHHLQQPDYHNMTWQPLLQTLPKKKKVNCTLVQALRLCTGRTDHRVNRGIALPFHDHGTRRWWGVSITPRPLFTPGKDPVPIVQEAGWAPGPVWKGAENLAPTGIRSADRPARSQSLYRLSYPAHKHYKTTAESQTARSGMLYCGGMMGTS